MLCSFFFLANKIDFEDSLVTFEEWGGGEKARVTSSGESPFGYLPTLTTTEGKILPETIAMSRYVARKVWPALSPAELLVFLCFCRPKRSPCAARCAPHSLQQSFLFFVAYACEPTPAG